MNKIYKYVLIIFIVLATGYLSYQHWTDPVYKLKVGTTLNVEDKRIESWGGRFQSDEDTLYVGYRTRLEDGVTPMIKIYYEEATPALNLSLFYPQQSEDDFYYITLPNDSTPNGRFRIDVIVEGEVLESTTFIWEQEEVN